jgi:glutamate-1-semialdehyde 2,1-aminomutase
MAARVGGFVITDRLPAQALFLLGGDMRSYAKSIALYDRTRKHLAGGVSSNVRYASVPVPLFFARGEGARLYDVDGNVHIDYVLGNGPAILGHAPKKVIDAVAASLVEGQLFAAQHPRETELAERLSSLLPGAEVVRFSTSGTEAVLMAMRLARAFTGRDRILKFEGHYHGWSDQAYISARPPLNEAGPANAPVPVAGSPGMPASVLGDVAVCGWNDLDLLAQALERHRGEIAAVIMEPVMVNGGAIPPLPGYLEGVRDLCRRHGALFICDEVITGFRIGLGGAQEKFGVTADLSIYAKAVAAGFPLAMVAGRRDVMDTLLDKGVMHGGTYNGNVQSMAAALAALDLLEADGGAVYRDLEVWGRKLMQGLAALAAKHKLPILVQGMPAVFQTFFTSAPAPRNYRESAACDRDMALALHAALQEEGVRIQQAGRWFLSTAHDAAVIAETLEAADRAMAKMVRH